MLPECTYDVFIILTCTLTGICVYCTYFVVGIQLTPYIAAKGRFRQPIGSKVVTAVQQRIMYSRAHIRPMHNVDVAFVAALLSDTLHRQNIVIGVDTVGGERGRGLQLACG